MSKSNSNRSRAERLLAVMLGFIFILPNECVLARTNPSPTPRLQQPLEKSQLAIDLEGLDTKDGGLSQGLRGSFLVKRYISGPWKGGTAVIETASDLSYAEIRIFDRESNLQRIYSIQPRSHKTRINPANIKNPLKMVAQVNEDDAAASHSEGSTVTRSPQREAAVQAQTERAMQVQEEERAIAAAEQSVSGILGQRSVPMEVTRLKRGTVRGRKGEIREEASENEPEETRTAPPLPKPASVAPEQTVLVKRTVRVRRKRIRKKSRNTLDVPLSGSPTKAKDEDEYYYEDVVVTERRPVAKKTSAPQVASAPPAAAPTPAPAAAPTASTQDILHPAPAVTQVDSESEINSLPVPETTQPEAAPSETITKKAIKPPSDSWSPKTTQVASLPPPMAESPAATPKSVPEKPVRDLVEVPLSEQIAHAKKADSLASDSWAPKNNVSKPSDAELGLTPLPPLAEPAVKKQRGGDDELVPASEQALRSGSVRAGEQWTPQTGSPKLTPQQEREQAIMNNLKPVAKPVVVKVNRDVNNPEEGITPFYSLEKYSGAQYGRHREFERRVIYKQNKKSPIQGYDFYIDEVDRKQEKHYLYYYKVDPKTKKVKLIATEKHEKVAFLSNYDVGTEDKGKIIRE